MMTVAQAKKIVSKGLLNVSIQTLHEVCEVLILDAGPSDKHAAKCAKTAGNELRDRREAQV